MSRCWIAYFVTAQRQPASNIEHNEADAQEFNNLSSLETVLCPWLAGIADGSVVTVSDVVNEVVLLNKSDDVGGFDVIRDATVVGT